MRDFTRGLSRLIVAAAALATVAAALVGVSSQVATAQIADLDPDLCATTYKPSVGAGDRTEADCRTIVAWRNSVVNHPDSVIGATHTLALWGTGGQVKFHAWAGLTVGYVNGERVITKVGIVRQGLAGPLPGELPDVQVFRLRSNFLTGELPAWVYDSASLEIFDVAYNQLSGAVVGERFDAPELAHLFLGGNRFSGALPNFDLTKLPKLRNLYLTRNFFSGAIPRGWRDFADGRGIQRIDIAYNNISGNLPSWISDLRFANAPEPSWTEFNQNYPYSLAWSYNKLCIPSNFAIPAYRKLNRQYATVAMYLEPQRCPSRSLSRPVENLQFVAVDADGQPTDENPVGLKVSWSKPQGMNGAAYSVWTYLNVPRTENETSTNGVITYEYCPGWYLPKGIAYTVDTELSVTITGADCRVATEQAFDPTKYTVAVVPITYNGRTAYTGYHGISNNWGIYMADDDQKTYADVDSVMSLGLDRSNIWVWDALNQVWIERNREDQDFASRNLEPGTALAVRRRVPLSWLAQAGLSTADEDTPVQLENGWNIISAGGDATRPSGNTGAFFIDENTLIDCGSSQGAIVIMRYSARSESFDAELPCHPSVEANLTSNPNIGTIEEIEEADTLFIYFRSVLPVTIQWDTASSKYIPTLS